MVGSARRSAVVLAMVARHSRPARSAVAQMPSAVWQPIAGRPPPCAGLWRPSPFIATAGLRRGLTSHTHFDGKPDPELHQAARDGRIDDVEKILALGDTDPSASDSKGMTALHLAAQSDHKQIVKMLCDGGANPNAQNDDGRTPLHLCMPCGYSACVVHLYNAGADDTIMDKDGKTALDQTSEDFGPQNY